MRNACHPHLPLLEDGGRGSLVAALVPVGRPQLIHYGPAEARAAHAGVAGLGSTVQQTGEGLRGGGQC